MLTCVLIDPTSVSGCSVVEGFEQHNDGSGGGDWNKADNAHTHSFHVFNSSCQTHTTMSKPGHVVEWRRPTV